MENVMGVFTESPDVEAALRDLRDIGITSDQINMLIPGSDAGDEIAVSETEGPGVGPAIGGIVGGATGAFAGLAIATATLPLVGPVIVVGVAAAAALGAVGGAAAGAALDAVDPGLPVDETYVYEDALRKGRTVLAVAAANHGQADRIRGLLEKSGAESVDAARDQWWTGLRSAEEAEYEAAGGDFDSDEPHYRRGFEAAQLPATRGKPYVAALPYLRRERYLESHGREAFRRGYERGQVHREKREESNAQIII